MKKTMRLIGLMGLIAAASVLHAEEKPAPTMPDEVTLTSGRVLKRVSVVRWEKDRVVLKYAGGVEPVHFSLIKNVSQPDLTAMRDIGTALKKANDQKQREELTRAQLAKEEAERSKAEEAAKCEEAAADGRLREGQTLDQVRRVLGREIRTNVYNSGRELQLIFERPIATYHCYIAGGILTSWQITQRQQ